MRSRVAIGVAVVALWGASLHAEEIKSGPQVGKGVGAYQVVKVGGAKDRNKIGKQLCYVWQYGAVKPLVIVFTQEVEGEGLTSLVKGLDKLVADTKSAGKKQVRAFVNVIGGDDREALEEKAKKIKSENLPVTVPVEFTKGPGKYGVNPKAGITIVSVAGRKVKTNHVAAPGKLNSKTVATILADIAKALK